MGFSAGGDNLRSPDDLPAGSGGFVLLGASTTPFWIAQKQVGLGLDVEGGIKYDAAISMDGGVSLRRFPIVITPHALLRVDDRWFLTLATGPYIELGIRFSRGHGESSTQTFFGDAIGLAAESGVMYFVGPVALDARIRYVRLGYETPGGDIDASHVSLLIGLSYFF